MSDHSEPGKSPTTLSDPADWLEMYGDFLYRYALIRLRDSMLAEDMVQETLLAAIQSKDGYRGRSSEKTWLTGILKHKIIDHLRNAQREHAWTDENAQEIDDLQDMFDAKGRWRIDISQWSEPDLSLERDDFWKIFVDCLQRLPRKMADALLLREMDGLETDTICQVLGGYTTNNVWVMLSRARMRMRRCLDTEWFEREPGDR